MIQPITPTTHSTDCAPGKRAQRARHWQAVLTRYDSSGLTQRAFCQREGIAYASFVSWLGKRRRTEARTGQTPQPGNFCQLDFGAASCVRLASQLEVVLMDGTVIRGDQPRLIAEVIQALR
jgi:hypothetical protein